MAATTVERVTALAAEMGGLAILAATLAAVTALVYRWYVREQVPGGLAVLVGVSGVAAYLNTTTALGQVIVGETAPTDAERALFNIAAFAIGAGGAVLGRRVGDRFGQDVLLGERFGDVDGDVGRLVKSVGRVVSVELPEEIEDATGYDPVPAATKEKLAGRTFLFPRGLTVDELRGRLIQRLQADYAVGHVDLELTDEGDVTYLALGSRAAGIGPTLPPATNAVALRADPAFAASAGDLVQVWETDPPRRVLTGELRGVADETVTVAIDGADTPKVDPTEQYRLVTLPVTDRPDREFASLLRAAEETFSTVSVEAGSPLHGLPVGALDLTVVAVRPEDGGPVALPAPSYLLSPGETVSAIARPEALRRLETAARPLDPSLVEPGRTRSAGPAMADQSPRQDTAAADQPPPNDRSESDDGGSGPDEPASSTAAAPDEPATGDRPDADSSEATGQADGSSFQDLKDEFETGEADWDGDEKDGTEDSESPLDETDDGGADRTTQPSSQADGSSFQDLKDEFEAGEADWSEDEDDNAPSTATEVAFGDEEEDDPTSPDDGSDDGTESDDDLFDGDDLSDLTFEDDAETADDDLAALGGETGDEPALEDDVDDLSVDNTEGTSADESDSEDGDDEDSDDEDEDDDDDSGGGGASFQQLKEEFESGEADWEDDISDSPGGDMRLDE
jgi:hypothetical protein